MEKRFQKILSVIGICIYLSLPAYGQVEVSWKCTPCHVSLSDALPKGHEAFTSSSCAGCHRKEGKADLLGKSIHLVHFSKNAEMINDCLSCHIPPKKEEEAFHQGNLGPIFSSWMSSPHLDSVHKENGVYCLDCHKTYTDPFEARDTQEECVRCHGNYDALIRKTEKTHYKNNPHKSHYVDLKCSICHKGHVPFSDYCADCHSFGYKWEKKLGDSLGGKQKKVEICQLTP
jgi:nitrate/TMAO reductase-like tetraheme cytochrome c subunit